MRRYLPLGALALAAILGGAALWLPGRQDPRPPPASAVRAPAAAPREARSPTPTPHTVGPNANRAEPAVAGKVPERTGPFPASPIGITLALQARAGEIAPCWHDWKDAHPEGPNQPILAVALGQKGLMDARLSGADGEEFDACVKRAMTDATFDPPEVEFLTLMVPVLIPNE